MAWDIQSGSLHYSIKAHQGWVNSVAFSPDGRMLVSGSMDKTIALWDVKTGKAIKRIDNQSSYVNSTTISPDGCFIAVGSVDEMVRLWDISKRPEETPETPETPEIPEIPMIFDGHKGPINCVRFSSDGTMVLSGSDDMLIKVWNVPKASEYTTLRGHTKKVMAVACSPDG